MAAAGVASEQQGAASPGLLQALQAVMKSGDLAVLEEPLLGCRTRAAAGAAAGAAGVCRWGCRWCKRCWQAWWQRQPFYWRNCAFWPWPQQQGQGQGQEVMVGCGLNGVGWGDGGGWASVLCKLSVLALIGYMLQ
jgi:hypothetical protein